MLVRCILVLSLCACTAVIEGADGDPEGPGRPGEPGPDPAIDEAPPLRLHRLNRLEYDNSVNELLGSNLRPGNMFPPDPSAGAFDNDAASLQLTPSLLTAYWEAARVLVDDAFADRPAFESEFEGDTLRNETGYPVGQLWALHGGPLEVQTTTTAGGFSLRVLWGGASTDPSLIPTLSVEVDGAGETLTITGTPALPELYEAHLDLTAGTHTFRFTPTNFVNLPAEGRSNDIYFRSVTVSSDASVTGPGYERAIPCVEQSETCALTNITTFASRAWRRPLQAEERDALTSLYRSVVAADYEDPSSALRLVFRAILVSPRFIYRAQLNSDQGSGDWLDPYALASRLSFFLWSRTPSDRLLEIAASGELSTEAGVRETVRWMLEDERAEGLSDGFAEQWLATRALSTIEPSQELYPDFDTSLRVALQDESKYFFGDYVTNGLPLSNMLAPDFAYRNARLNAHFGLPPGDEDFRRVSVSGADRRGVLALGAWLVTHSDTEIPSPIKRGRWFAESILCDPVPPPPPGLVFEAPDVVDEASIREQLALHRDSPACAGCHNRLDVIGMGFQEFDAVGRARPIGDVDTEGELPSGLFFEGASEAADAIRSREFVSCLSEKLMVYALGRHLTPYDETTLSDMDDTLPDPTLLEVVTRIALSPSFRSPVSEETAP